MKSPDPVNEHGLRAEGLHVSYRSDDRLFPVVTDVGLSVEPGDALGVVGESGSGKSTLALALAGLLRSDEALVSASELTFQGADLLSPSKRANILGRRIGFVFQNPHVALNPVLTIERQLTDHLQWHLQIPHAAAVEKAERLLTEVGIPDPPTRLRSYPHEFSGGMLQRITIAIALACDPDLLIADEPTTALDASVQADIVELIGDIRRSRRLSLVWITHDLALLRRVVDRVAVMYAGRLVELGPASVIYGAPSHPYTKALLETVVSMWGDEGSTFRAIEGSPAKPGELKGGCPFRPRCPVAFERCSEMPPLRPSGPAHVAACWRVPSMEPA